MNDYSKMSQLSCFVELLRWLLSFGDSLNLVIMFTSNHCNGKQELVDLEKLYLKWIFFSPF